MRSHFAMALALALAACGGSGGGSSSTSPPAGTPNPPSPPSPQFLDTTSYSSASTASLSSPNEITAVTKHQLTLGATTLNYTATVGHLTALTLTNPTAEASFFYVAYTLDGASAATRPVTFFYNGGPGSATVWLHLGSFGPKRLATNAPSTTTPTPFAFVDNTESLLDMSDLVFVDAISTGFSEAVTPNVNRTFWTTDADAAVFRDFVIRYIAVNNRGASPKYLFGESYGTPRSAILANLLESAGTSLTGVVMQSSILNYNSNCGVFTPAVGSCHPFLPSYAAVGAWLNLTTPAHPVAQLPDYMVQMRGVADTMYLPAIQAGSVSPGLATTLAADTGLSQQNWTSHFNMDPTYFHTALIPGSVIGYYDGRMVAQLGTPLAADSDPSSTFYNDSFASTIVSYLSNDLHYTTPSTYTMSSSAINVWNFSHAGNFYPDTVPDLGAAMTLNPNLKVHSVGGYHDILTPFHNSELDLQRLGNPNPRIATHFYEGGHMTYLDDVGRQQEKADLVAFYQGTAVKKASPLPVPVQAAVVETPASTAPMPPAVFETKLHGPWAPWMQGRPPAPATTGDALQAEIEDRIRTIFNAAPAKRAGSLTRDEAAAAGLGYVVNNFAAIDARGTGAVTFEDVKNFMRARGAQTLPD
ncbi:MAG TPA: hypothetical protein VKR38_08515 [Usitatibacter sp.]|nr:hypothetical protein [Usitatibacter sp.]